MDNFLDTLINLPDRTWAYSQQRPLEAFTYSFAILALAWGSRTLLSLVALTLIIGSLAKLIRQKY